MKRTTLALLIALAGWTATAKASTIRFEFEGNVTQANGIWVGQGTDVAGSFSYDSRLVDTYAGSTATDVFESTGPAPNPTLLWDITVTVGAVTRSTSGNAMSVGQLILIDNLAQNHFILESLQSNSFTDDSAEIRLLGDGHAPSFSLTDMVPTYVDLSEYNILKQGLYRPTTGGNNEGWVVFEITSITNPVPEPSLLASLSGILIAALTAASRQRGRRPHTCGLFASDSRHRSATRPPQVDANERGGAEATKDTLGILHSVDCYRGAITRVVKKAGM